MTGILGLITALLTIVGFVMDKRYNPDATKKRKDKKVDEEIAKKDHAAKSKRLSDLMDDTE